MNPSLQIQLSDILDTPIQKIVPVSGGDISSAYMIHTASGRFFCKMNERADAHDMFLSETEGLQAIAKTHTIKVPGIIMSRRLERGSLLILEYIEPGHASAVTMKELGHQLAALHSVYHTEFGWSSPNYIGSLPQSNKVTNSWASFYQEERLQPQLQLALDKKWLAQEDVPSTSLMMEKLQQLLPAAKPSLLHGDLWGGNYLISASGIPYLIDPAVYYGHQEVDLAMTRLFGGFDTSFYDAYNELLPPNDGWQDRTGLYQLYYLLVHLNLFGSSYLNSVLKWLRYYF